MISIDFCEKMSHATTRLDVFRRAVVSTPAIFFPRKPARICLKNKKHYRFLIFLAVGKDKKCLRAKNGMAKNLRSSIFFKLKFFI